ncbi:MAG: alcohol dehydrogenase catalytic domain-containing protein [Syntrophales bacterium]|nr:alcohol dehydrogenase catalytic domain-containing protein [Syntrophales bacterium]
MKAIIVEEVGSFKIKNINIPYPKTGEVLVHVKIAGLCRTDLKLIRVGHRDLVLPRVPGEEVVGTIFEIGSDVSGLSQGQRVYIYPGKACDKCKLCRTDAENLCRKMKIMGFHRNGGFAEYVLSPAKSIIPIPDNLPDEEAVFAEPLSCCLNALELSRLKKGETIGIWGAGPAGLLLSRAAIALNATPFIIEPDNRRRSFANGFEKPPETGFDVCIVAVGSVNAYCQSLSHLNPRGRLVIFSGLAPDRTEFQINFNQLHYHEQTLVGAYGCSYRHGQQALEFLGDKKVKVNDLISHKMPLWELEEALKLVEQRKSIKILLYP